MQQPDPSTQGNQPRPSADDDAALAAHLRRFEIAKARIDAFEAELRGAREHMHQVRTDIRQSGGYEPDSLLVLSDGEDNPMLTHVLQFLAIEDLWKRVELTCKALKRQAAVYWSSLDGKIADDCKLKDGSMSSKQRVIVHRNVSTIAARFALPPELGGDHAAGLCNSFYSDPKWKGDHECYIEIRESGQEEPYSKKCTFFRFNGKDQMRVLVKPEWMRLAPILHPLIGSSIWAGKALDEETFNSLQKRLQDLTLTIVSVHRESLKAKLAFSQKNFFHNGRGKAPVRHEKNWKTVGSHADKFAMLFQSYSVGRIPFIMSAGDECFRERRDTAHRDAHGILKLFVKTDATGKVTDVFFNFEVFHKVGKRQAISQQYQGH